MCNLESTAVRADVRSSMSIRALGWLAGMVLMAASSAMAAHAPAEVILDRTAIPPGGKATIAVVFKIEPGWHLYWTNPGEAGAPPKVKWTLPAGVAVSDLQFPVPKRKVISDLTAFVYEDQVALLADVTVPADARGSIELKGHVKVVVCEEACVLEEQDVTLTIPIGTGQEQASERFSAWRASQPIRHSPLREVAATLDPDAKHGLLTVEMLPGITGQEFFPPRTRFLTFENPEVKAGRNNKAPLAYHMGFRVLPDPPAEFSGPGIVVTKDESGKTS
ncbi:MAG: Thiol:disulfide interchange protein, partial [Phycisphaerales bacterium]|nr:Thiol:disulfide interchange protein [Phycisphaerales bacterium]